MKQPGCLGGRAHGGTKGCSGKCRFQESAPGRIEEGTIPPVGLTPFAEETDEEPELYELNDGR
jgi:hypothetical protein